jgi:ketosteroid isomerase-like protein
MRMGWGAAFHLARGCRQVAALAALTAAAVACSPDPGAGPSGGTLAALEARQAEFLEAMAARDAGRVAALFAEDAVLHVANMPPVEGRDAITGFYGNLFGFLVASTAVPERLERSEGGGMAWGAGRTSNAFQGPGGPVAYAGKYAMVWRHDEGEWRIVLYAVSSDQSESAR